MISPVAHRRSDPSLLTRAREGVFTDGLGSLSDAGMCCRIRVSLEEPVMVLCDEDLVRAGLTSLKLGEVTQSVPTSKG